MFLVAFAHMGGAKLSKNSLSMPVHLYLFPDQQHSKWSSQGREKKKKEKKKKNDLQDGKFSDEGQKSMSF